MAPVKWIHSNYINTISLLLYPFFIPNLLISKFQMNLRDLKIEKFSH